MFDSSMRVIGERPLESNQQEKHTQLIVCYAITECAADGKFNKVRNKIEGSKRPPDRPIVVQLFIIYLSMELRLVEQSSSYPFVTQLAH